MKDIIMYLNVWNPTLHTHVSRNKSLMIEKVSYLMGEGGIRVINYFVTEGIEASCLSNI